MSTCGSCKHWGDERNAGSEFRPCKAIVHDHKHFTDSDDPTEDVWKQDLYFTQEELEAMQPDERARAEQIDVDLRVEVEGMRAHLAVVRDGTGDYAALKTKENFGCVLWKKAR